MDFGDLATTITALATLIAATTAALIARRNAKRSDSIAAAAHKAAEDAAAGKAEIIRVGGEVYELGRRVDGRLSDLLAASMGQARAEGRAEGESAVRAEQREQEGGI